VETLPILSAVAATYLFAGLIKGVIGGGLPTISIGILGLVMPIPDAVALVVLPSLVTNAWQALGKHTLALLRRIWPMLCCIAVGAYFGRDLMSGAYRDWASTGLGLALVVYSIIGLSKLRLHLTPKFETWVGVPVGIATGFIAAGTGVFVIPSGPYLQAIGLRKNDLVQALGITYTVSTVVLAMIVARAGSLHADIAVASVVALVAALVGMYFGQKMLDRLDEETFRKMFFAGLLVLGAHLVLRNLM
jgi:uncharacterized membrane protein YfcA